MCKNEGGPRKFIKITFATICFCVSKCNKLAKLDYNFYRIMESENKINSTLQEAVCCTRETPYVFTRFCNLVN